MLSYIPPYSQLKQLGDLGVGDEEEDRGHKNGSFLVWVTELLVTVLKNGHHFLLCFY